MDHTTRGRAIILRTEPDGGAQWYYFEAPDQVITAWKRDDVQDALVAIDQATKAGFYAVGMIAYEAAQAFDAALPSTPTSAPLLEFGIFKETRKGPAPKTESIPYPSDWQPAWSAAAFARKVETIHEAIAAGETYQVNLTFPLSARYAGDPLALFAQMVAAQPVPHAAFLDLGSSCIASASPELFFRLHQGHLVSRPMKGTCPRGRTLDEDQGLRHQLQNAAKDRAENLMVVDMIRNDVGRVAVPGTVRTTALFSIERYRTVWQMTSTIEAETRATWLETLAALFPCASITGAPKNQTMKLIQKLEGTARGVYTGTIGSIFPDGSVDMNVAIRTAVIDQAASRLTLAVGAGIVWDSKADAEYAECLSKARFLTAPVRPFDLLETMRWEPTTGIHNASLHWARMERSAQYFDRPFSLTDAQEAIAKTLPPAVSDPLRLRMLLKPDGSFIVETHPIIPWPSPLQACLDDRPTPTDSPFLFHKTTVRGLYEEAQNRHPDFQEVLLWNQEGRATEFLRGNLVVRKGEDWLTPPVSDGLLAGICRQRMLEAEELTEQSLRLTDLENADEIFFINSLRGLQKVALHISGGPCLAP